MADVAERAGVSLSTVSLTYSGAGPITDDTKARVEKAAAEIGYLGPSALGRSLRSGSTHIVGLVLYDDLGNSFRDPCALQTMNGIVTTLGNLGLGVLLIPSPSDEDDSPLLDTAPIDAAIVMRVFDHDDPSMEILRRRGIPAVVMEGPAPTGAGIVTIDDEKATAELITHLVGLGHTRIATVTLPFDLHSDTRVIAPEDLEKAAWNPTRNRLTAFKRAGIEPCVVVEARASMVDEGLAAGHLALAHPSKPTAIVCQSDLLAAGVVLAARELELRVPQDVSVTGFDGLDLPWLAPHELTTVVQDALYKGQLLAKEVQALLDGDTPAPIDLPVSLRIGTTTTHPPK
ncbi:MAG: LacI family DNA-binding transcriptional regulator [Demequinaceae bacterium]|nr:LacI family DNA-binding transcriptional regulator [Demequinaceae bacterium]